MAFLLDDILLSPITALKWIAEKIEEVAEADLNDGSKVREELLELQMRLELGDIAEEEYQKREAELMMKLDEIKKRKERV